MNTEVITTARTIESAVADGARQLGVSVSAVEYEVLEQPKKGFLGFGETDAKVRVYCVITPETKAMRYVNALISNLELDAHAAMTADTVSNGTMMISITGQSAGILIGHHGDTLDSLQYLVNLAANRRAEEEESESIKVTVDIENYRAKREETLRRLARSIAQRVQKSRKSVTLEPMSPYERRIIHAEIQEFRGVTTASIGKDKGRRVVVSPDGAAPGGKNQTQTRRPPRKRQAHPAEAAPVQTPADSVPASADEE